VVTDARLLDVESGEVRRDRTLVIADGEIREIRAGDRPVPGADRALDARGRLVTPGLVDAHGHMAYVLGDSVSFGGGSITDLHASPDSLAAYRERYARAYLPHGVTTVRDVGSSEADLALLSDWYREPSPGLPDFHPSGGALVSPPRGDRATYQAHVVVPDPEAARAKVRSYRERGFRHLKLYWRLREPEFRAALEEARRLDMNVTGHVDFHVLGFERALELGLRSFEHAYTVGVGAMTDAEYRRLWQQDVPAAYGDRRRGLFHLGVTEVFQQLGPDDPDTLALIDRLARTGSTVTTSLHIFAQQVGVAPFVVRTGTAFDDVSDLTDGQRARAREGYGILADYVRRMHEAGVRLALAPDWVQPGRVALSEMWLLHRAGIPMEEVFRIATLQGARAIDLRDRGSLEPGMPADLVIWEEDPLADRDALFGGKTVIRAGRVVAPEG
jgi:imidazolonepropionase-like amidohydrolase